MDEGNSAAVDRAVAHQAVVVRLSGDLTSHTAARVTASLEAATATTPPPRLVVIDLRGLGVLADGGVRALRDVAASAAGRGVRCALLADPDGATGRVLATADPGSAVPWFADLAEAMAALPEAAVVPGPDPVAGHRTTAAAAPLADVAHPDRIGMLARQFEDLTRTLLDATTVGDTLQQVVHLVTLVVPDADLVSVTLRAPDGTFSTPATTDPVAVELDHVQYRSGRGPCVDAASPDTPGYVASADLGAEDRWPDFAAAATRHGYRSVLCTELGPVAHPRHLSGALNIYSRRPGRLTDTSRHIALILASHASLAFAHASTVEIAELKQAHLRRAIDSRDVIGQAKGILMTRQRITSDEAFDLLRRTSQALNVKLVDLARTLADQPDIDPT